MRDLLRNQLSRGRQSCGAANENRVRAENTGLLFFFAGRKKAGTIVSREGDGVAGAVSSIRLKRLTSSQHPGVDKDGPLESGLSGVPWKMGKPQEACSPAGSVAQQHCSATFRTWACFRQWCSIPAKPMEAMRWIRAIIAGSAFLLICLINRNIFDQRRFVPITFQSIIVISASKVNSIFSITGQLSKIVAGTWPVGLYWFF